MCRIALVLATLACLLYSSANARPAGKPLYGLAVVIDPGHGGQDPGAHGSFKLYGHGPAVTVDEAPYVYDVALRVAELVKKQGGIVILTRHDAHFTRANDGSASVPLPFKGNHDVYTYGGAGVRARTVGMLPRMRAAQEWQSRFARNHHIAFVSIHFDIESVPTIQGAHVIAPSGGSTVATLISNELIAHNRMRTHDGHEFMPLAVSGDRGHGVRNLYILNARNNPIRDRALVELGNFANSADVWRLRDPKVRQSFAVIIAAALAKFNT